MIETAPATGVSFSFPRLSTLKTDQRALKHELKSSLNKLPLTPPPDSPRSLSFEPELKHDAKTTITELRLTPPPESTPTKQYNFSTAASGRITLSTEPLVAVVGLSSLDTHLVSNFSRHWDVLGFDESERRVRAMSMQDEFVSNDRVAFTSSPSDLSAATHYIISVPTLLRSDNTVDASHLEDAVAQVFNHARQGATVIIESSVAVGMTRELLGPMAKARGCFAGMSPARSEPGRVEPPAHLVPKIVSGLDDMCPGSLAAITRLYGPVFDTLVPVSRPEVAEFTKLYENCQRMVNIAYANEMADACAEMDIDPYEVCAAAGTKPFGYMDFAPGAGVGGHCIPVNPWYLLSGCEMPLLRSAAERMARRPSDIASEYVANLGRNAGRGGRIPRVLVVGMGFKRGQGILSYSPGVELATRLHEAGDIEVTFADPLVAQQDLPEIAKLDDEHWNVDSLENFDLAIVLVRQVGLDFSVLEKARGRGIRVKWLCR